jgi:hypothetical protein
VRELTVKLVAKGAGTVSELKDLSKLENVADKLLLSVTMISLYSQKKL